MYIEMPKITRAYVYAIKLCEHYFLCELLCRRTRVCDREYCIGVDKDCYGLFPLKTIYKVFHHFHFQFATYWTSVNMNVKLYPEINCDYKLV